LLSRTLTRAARLRRFAVDPTANTTTFADAFSQTTQLIPDTDDINNLFGVTGWESNNWTTVNFVRQINEAADAKDVIIVDGYDNMTWSVRAECFLCEC
jgi:hypothetical protein